MKDQGFTLVELLVVIAILATAIGVTGDVILSLIRSYTKTQITNEIEQNANYISLKLEKELRSSIHVTSVSATQLVFQDKNGVLITYDISGNVIQRTFGVSGTAYPLTSNNAGGVSVTCGGNCFELVNSLNPTVVELNLTFSQYGNPGVSFTSSVTLNNVIVARGTY